MDAHIPVPNADEPIEEQDDQQSTEQDAMMVNENDEVNNNNDADRGLRERSGILASNKIACYVGSAVLGWVLFFIFLGLYIYEKTGSKGGEILPTPVVLKLTSIMLAPENTSENEQPFRRMFISGYNTSENGDAKLDIVWKEIDGFWYLEVSPIRSTFQNCPIKRQGMFGRYEEILQNNPSNTSSCSLYDFRIVIFNDLDAGATVHFHGLTPPSNQDGVPFVANANIHPQNLQKYRFNQFTYPGMHWMHAHTGFQEAYGVAAPIILQHDDYYFNAKQNKFSKEDDLVVMLEEGFIHPLCAYSPDWYSEECKSIDNSAYGKLAFLINRRENPLDHKPKEGVQFMRLRFLNGGSEAPWRITDKFSESYNGTNSTMDILATDGQDVETGIARREFVLGLANRIDVLIEVDSSRDILITAEQMKHSGDVKDPALRHIVIRGQDTPEDRKIKIENLPSYNKNKTSPILKNFNLLDNLTAAHPLSERKITRGFTIKNRGGDQYGGFPLTIYEGLGSNESDLRDLYPVNTYTELNQLKFQLPPYKVYRSKRDTNIIISTRRKCEDCATKFSQSGIKVRPPNDGSLYEIPYTTGNPPNGTEDVCCWEWCDIPEDRCGDFELERVKEYKSNKHYIPVCYGDRVRILFINTASFEGNESHPMHLHGHDFVLRELYDVDKDGNLSINKTFSVTGPKLDTIWVPFNQAVSFDFDAYNPGEHLFHCHNDFHLENGMMTTVRYMHNDWCPDLPEFVGGESVYPKQLCTMNDCTPSGLNHTTFDEL